MLVCQLGFGRAGREFTLITIKKAGYDADKLTMVFLFLTQAYIYKRMKLVKG